jgi:hypothetical protein
MNLDDSGPQPPFPTPSTTAEPPYNINPFSPTILTVFQRPKSPPSCIVRGAWTEAEDESLRGAVCCLGAKKWSEVCAFVPSRTGKQCRERWPNQLAPGIKKGPSEVWDDRAIFEKRRELGNKWATIVRLLPGRIPGVLQADGTLDCANRVRSAQTSSQGQWSRPCWTPTRGRLTSDIGTPTPSLCGCHLYFSHCNYDTSVIKFPGVD